MSTAELLLENRSMGWVSAETAPNWAKNRIVEVRKAQLEKRSAPPPSIEYIAAAEKRSASARSFVSRFLPNRKCLEQRFFELRGYEPCLMRMKAERIALEIKREARLLAAAARKARPDYLCTADEVYHRNMAREYQARAIAQTEVRACRAKDAEGHHKAADFHASVARNFRSAEQARLHYDAVSAHQRAAENLTEQTASDAHQTCLVARNWVDPSTGGKQ